MACGNFCDVELESTLLAVVKKGSLVVGEQLDCLSTSRVGDNVLEFDVPLSDSDLKSKGLVFKCVPLPDEEVPTRQPRKKVEKKVKFGHMRVHADGGVSYKKINSTVIMEYLQLGIRKSVGGMMNSPERDVLMKDFMTVESTTFYTNETGPTALSKQSFVFKTYAPIAFRYFRDLFEINPCLFVSSFCDSPLVELSNSGASESLFYLSQNDEFIIKTVQHKEANFLQKLLPGYYLNLNQNPCTLLPKFFGLYCCKRDSKNVRMVVMNNVLPSWIEIHQKYDLKGSTFNRAASKNELEKGSPTFKDLDFVEHHKEGIFLEISVYKKLIETIQRDCRVLESFQIIDYSLLVGIHNLDLARMKSLQTGKSEDTVLKEEMNNKSSGDGITNVHEEDKNNGSYVTTEGFNENVSFSEKEHGYPVKLTEANFVLRALPATQANGEKLLLFVGIIDILQSYRLKKKVEHVLKSVVYDGDSVSVHNPAFYARRFQDFMINTVFKPFPPSPRCKRKNASRTKPSDKKPDNSNSAAELTT